MLPPMHPLADVIVYPPPTKPSSSTSRPGGVKVPATDSALGTVSMEVVDEMSDVRRGEGTDIKLKLGLWPRDLTSITYQQGQIVQLTYRGETERLQIKEVIGPWDDGDPDDSIELKVRSRQGEVL